MAVVASLVVAAVALASTFIGPAQRQRFTDFYVLGPNGSASDIPSQLNVSEFTYVTLGIANHEFVDVSYTVRTDLVGVRIV